MTVRSLMPELAGDLLVGEATGDAAEHLVLPRGQGCTGQLSGFGRGSPSAEQGPGHLRVEGRTTRRCGPDGVEDLLWVGVLQEIAVRAGIERVHDAALLRERRQHHHPALGVPRLDLPGRLHAVEHRHRQVHQHHVDHAGVHRGDRLLAIANAAHELQIARSAKELFETVTHDAVVVDHQHLDRLGHDAGTSMQNDVPPVAGFTRVNRPPRSATRSPSTFSPT